MRAWARGLILALWIIIGAACAPSVTPTATPAATAVPTLPPVPTATEPFVPQSAALTPAEQISLRVIHAAQGTGAVDIAVEALTIASQLGFGQAVDGPQIGAGEYAFTVRPAGDANTTLLATSLELAGGQRYSLLLAGEADSLSLTPLQEDSTPLPPAVSRLQFIHAAPELGAVELREAGAGTLLPSTSFASIASSVEVPPADVPVLFFSADNPVTDYTLEAAAGRQQLLILVANAQGQPQVLQFNAQPPAEARIRVVHAADESVGSVDVYLGSERIATELVFGSASELRSVPAEPLTLRVVTAGTPVDGEPLFVSGIIPGGGEIDSVILTGGASTLQINTHVERSLPLQPETTSVTFGNFDPAGETLIGVDVEGGIQPAPEIGYGQFSAPLLLSPGRYQLEWRPVSGSTREATEDTREFEPGSSYLYIYTGRPDAPALVFEQPVELIVPAAQIAETARVRWVNLISGTNNTFRLDDAVQEPGLSYTNSRITEVEGQNYVLTLETGAGSTTAEFAVQPFRSYSVYAHGTAESPQVLVVEDDRPRPEAGYARVRLVHVGSSNDPALSLGVGENTSGAENPSYEPTLSADSPLTIPFGVQMLVSGTTGGSASLWGRLPEGRYDFYLIDMAVPGVLAYTPAIVLGDRAFLEVVALRSPGSELITVLVLPVTED